MTLQDYFNLVNDSLNSFIQAKFNIAIPILAALLIFLLGLVLASLLRRIWLEILKAIELEKNLSKNSVYSQLIKTNKNLSVTEFVSQLIWWVTVLIFLLPSLKILNLNQVDQIVNQFLIYLPNLATGAFYLLFGSVFAWFSYLIVLAIGGLTRLNSAVLIAKIVSLSVTIFSLLLALKAFGVSEEMLRVGILASIAAVTLAFGLSGKEMVTEAVKKIRDFLK